MKMDQTVADSGGFFDIRVKGFSLIEILVTISLVGIGIGMAVVSFTATSRRERVTNTADRVRQLLQQAKSNAQHGVKDCLACGAASGVCGQGDVPLQGWRVTFNTLGGPPHSVTLEGWCSAAPYPAAGTVFSSRTEMLPDGVEMTTTGHLVSVLYRARGGGISASNAIPDGNSRTINLTQGPDSSAVMINSAGDIF